MPLVPPVPRAGATGIEPAISGLTGRRVNHYTTPPERTESYQMRRKMSR